ncbi:hypothetical protein AB0N77_33260 [Streptomyces misionensis]|uniref:hypothetical protein n=1 Tax=Streptomyces misionensis TaxID=67331 RepID=UPI0034217319
MTSCAEPSARSASGDSLWRHRDFRRYLTGQAASVAGSSITQMALPVPAVLHLGATPAQVAWPAFLGQLPPALLGDVGSFLISAGCTARVQARDPASHRLEARRLREEIGEGLRYVRGDERLVTLTLVNATTSFALGLLNTLWALHLLRTLAVSETAFGVVLGLGALGAAAGALTAPALARRWDPGPMMLTALAITPLAQIPLLVASPGLRWQITIAVALFLQLACAGAARGLGILPGPVGDGLPEQVVEAMSNRFLAAVPQLGATRPLQILITRHQLGGSQPRPAQERQSHRWSSLRTSPLPPQCQHRAHPALRYHCTSSDLRLVLARFPTTETTMSTMPAKRRELPLEALSGDWEITPPAKNNKTPKSPIYPPESDGPHPCP